MQREERRGGRREEGGGEGDKNTSHAPFGRRVSVRRGSEGEAAQAKSEESEGGGGGEI